MALDDKKEEIFLLVEEICVFVSFFQFLCLFTILALFPVNVCCHFFFSKNCIITWLVKFTPRAKHFLGSGVYFVSLKELYTPLQGSGVLTTPKLPLRRDHFLDLLAYLQNTKSIDYN